MLLVAFQNCPADVASVSQQKHADTGITPRTSSSPLSLSLSLSLADDLLVLKGTEVSHAQVLGYRGVIRDGLKGAKASYVVVLGYGGIIRDGLKGEEMSYEMVLRVKNHYT